MHFTLVLKILFRCINASLQTKIFMKLFYRKYGSGPPFFILHALYGCSDNWITIARNLSSRFTVYLPDLRNHGQSPHSPVHDYESMSNDLHELVMDLEIDKFFLAGHSMGGKTAVSFAIKWPEMLLGLLVADISPFTDEKDKKRAAAFHSSILKAIIKTDLSAARSRADIDMQLINFIESGKIRDLIMKNIQRDDNNKFKWKINAPSLMNNLRNIVEGFTAPDDYQNQITGFPVTFLKGENSDYITTENFSDTLKLFPAAELKVIKNAGHWLNADNPAAVTASLSDLFPA
jgi:esterase